MGFAALNPSYKYPALLAHQLVDDLLGDIVLPVAAGIPAPRADRVALLDQRLDFVLDHGAVAVPIGALQVELVKPVPNLGQPGALLGREGRNGGGHGPLSVTRLGRTLVTRRGYRWGDINSKPACFQSPTARTRSPAPPSWRRINRA